jgi:hypothetical protein
MNQSKFILEVIKQDQITREKVGTREYPYPVPVLPIGTVFIFGNSPTRVHESVITQETVQEDGQWVDVWKQSIIVEFI